MNLAQDLAERATADAMSARHCIRTQNKAGEDYFRGRAEAMLEACLVLQDRWYWQPTPGGPIKIGPDAGTAMAWLLRFMDDTL